MRTSEYYAQGIHSFFIGYGLDALERHHGVEVGEKTEPESTPGRIRAEDDTDFDYDEPAESCQCPTTIHPPCSYCEHAAPDPGGLSADGTNTDQPGG